MNDEAEVVVSTVNRPSSNPTGDTPRRIQFGCESPGRPRVSSSQSSLRNARRMDQRLAIDVVENTQRLRRLGFIFYVVLSFSVVGFCMAMLMLHFVFQNQPLDTGFYTNTISAIVGTWAGIVLSKLLGRQMTTIHPNSFPDEDLQRARNQESTV